jgi:predicted transcriptional regulator
MALVLDLEPEEEEQLRARAEREGRAPETIAKAMLSHALAWEEQEHQELWDGIERGLADMKAGRGKPLQQFIDEQRQKHGLSLLLT